MQLNDSVKVKKKSKNKRGQQANMGRVGKMITVEGGELRQEVWSQTLKIKCEINRNTGMNTKYKLNARTQEVYVMVLSLRVESVLPSRFPVPNSYMLLPECESS